MKLEKLNFFINSHTFKNVFFPSFLNSFKFLASYSLLSASMHILMPPKKVAWLIIIYFFALKMQIKCSYLKKFLSSIFFFYYQSLLSHSILAFKGENNKWKTRWKIMSRSNPLHLDFEAKTYTLQLIYFLKVILPKFIIYT